MDRIGRAEPLVVSTSARNAQLNERHGMGPGIPKIGARGRGVGQPGARAGRWSRGERLTKARRRACYGSDGMASSDDICRPLGQPCRPAADTEHGSTDAVSMGKADRKPHAAERAGDESRRIRGDHRQGSGRVPRSRDIGSVHSHRWASASPAPTPANRAPCACHATHGLTIRW